ncbi:MAG: extracellular solute-binding protein [Clostridia bacterium]|nr:extracellular solute-binding protein [Clostridia bacterium]
MKKNWKRICAGVMVAAMAVTFVACGGGNNGESKGSVAVSGVNEFPIVQEPTTLSIFCAKPYSVSDIETNDFTKWYEEKTGVKVQWDLINGDARQALNLKLASEDYSDVFYGFWLSRSEQAAYHNQGVLIDMTDLVDKHGYYIKEMFESNPYIEEHVRHTDNKVLGLPTLNMGFSNDTESKMWVYKPWLDKLNLKVPETTEEFYEMLKAFKTQDPNGNGKADEVPLAGRNARGLQTGIDNYLMSAFTTWGRYGIYNDNGTVKFAPISEDAKEGIKYMHKLYEEGLIHPESFVMDRARVTALGENDVPILGAAPGKWTIQFTVGGSSTNRSNEFVAIPPLKGPKGVQQTTNSGDTDPGLSMFSITSTCENPEVAIKWADWFYSQEAYLKTKANEGTRLANEGETGFDGEQATLAIDPVDSSQVFGAVQNNRWLDFALGYLSLEDSIKTANHTIDLPREKNAYEAYKMYAPYRKDGLVLHDFPIPTEDTAEFLELRANILSAIDSGVVSFIIGEKSIEKDWDAYVQNFYNLGLERFIEIAQNYVDTL